MFKTILGYLKHLISLIEQAEDLIKKPGAEKKARVLAEFCNMLSDLPKKEREKLPAFLLNPENIGCLIDLAVAIGKFINSKKSAYLLFLAKALLSGGEER